MAEKYTAVEAVEKIEKLMIELQLALDSAERFHQRTKHQRFGGEHGAAAGTGAAVVMPSTRNADDTDTGETEFKANRLRTVQQTPEEHTLRMKHCQHNRDALNKLNDRIQGILNDYQADLKDHHHIDEGARLLEIVQAVEDTGANGHWEQGLFFRTIGTKLKVTSEILHESAMLWRAHVQTEAEKTAKEAPTGAVMHTVYVSLYQAGGQQLKNWQYMLSHLAEHTMGRPAYTEREHVEQFIRSRAVPSNEAYLVANVLEKNILGGMGKGGVLEDSQGRPMLSLGKGAVQLQHILEFVNSTGAFEIKDGRLIPLIKPDKS